MRNFFSIISGAALLGVALGVAILLVIISVMNGFEIEVKKRLLAFSPHITLKYAPNGPYDPITNWGAEAEKIRKIPGIIDIVGTIDDNAIIEHKGNQLPISYRGIDTTDLKQVGNLDKLVIKDYEPFGSSDMGLEAKGVILESKANQFGIEVGDTIQLYSTRNFDDVFDAYKRTERDRASVEFKDNISQALDILKTKRLKDKALETYHYNDLNLVFDLLSNIANADIRASEKATLNEALDILDSGVVKGPKEEFRQIEKGATEHLQSLLLIHLPRVDITTDDNAELKKLKSIVLPKDIKIIGIYRISQQVVAPDIFLPLPIAQELSGLDEGVHALSIRLDDVDQAEAISQNLSEQLPYGWYPSSWMSRYKEFFELIALEKSMMSMVLSVVAAGSAFLIMIVMFLTALQKRKEIGVMLAIGASPSQICGIFFIQGIIIGIFGVALGIGLGLTILHFRAEIQMLFLQKGVDIFPAGFQGMDSLPADTPPQLILNISIMALAMCSLAPLLPAMFAALTDPAKSLRDL